MRAKPPQQKLFSSRTSVVYTDVYAEPKNFNRPVTPRALSLAGYSTLFGSLRWRLVKDSCNVIATITGLPFENRVLGSQLLFRNPSCTPNYEKIIPKKPKRTDADDFEFPLKACDAGMFINYLGGYYGEFEGLSSDNEFWIFYKERYVEIEKIEYPDFSGRRVNNASNRISDIAITYKVSETTRFNGHTQNIPNPFDFRNIEALFNAGYTPNGNPGSGETIWTREQSVQYIHYFAFDNQGRYQGSDQILLSQPNNLYSEFIWYQDGQIVVSNITYEDFITYDPANRTSSVRADDKTTITYNREWLFVCPKTEAIYPPPPKYKEDMACCPQNDQLLRLILKRLGSLPAKVPDNFTKQEPTQITKESLAELILWQTKQLDALIGAYPIKIKNEDTDLTQSGNQSEEIIFPNLAEAIAELIGLGMTTKRDTHAILITAIKAMTEAGMAKQAATKAVDVGLANAEYLGYKLEQKHKKIPLAFTPNAKKLDEALKEKEIDFITYENTDKKDLQDDLKILLTMAARWNAQNWRKLGADATESLREYFLGRPGNIANEGREEDNQDFDVFTEQVERGFIDISGITDTTNPYGRPYDERPRVREIGKDDADNG